MSSCHTYCKHEESFPLGKLIVGHRRATLKGPPLGSLPSTSPNSRKGANIRQEGFYFTDFFSPHFIGVFGLLELEHPHQEVRIMLQFPRWVEVLFSDLSLNPMSATSPPSEVFFIKREAHGLQ